MITLLIFIGTILVLVGVHEGGHFLVAKLVGVYVEEFAIGFGPKLLAFSGRETRYSIRAIPFGGYVRMAGEDREETSPEIPAARLLYNKPPLARILISLAGPAANLLITLLVALVALWSFGLPFLQVADTIPGKPAFVVLQPGDRAVAIAGRPVYNTEAVSQIIQESKGEPVEFLVERNGKLERFTITPRFDPLEERYLVGAYFLPITYTNELLSLDPSSPFFRAGLRQSDRIVAVEGETVKTAIGIINRLNELLPTDSLTVTVLRGGEEIQLLVSTIELDLNEIFTGITFADLGIDTRRPGLLAGLTLGAGQFSEDFRLMVQTLRGILTGRIAASEAVTGPIGIARLLGEGLQLGPSIFLRLFSFLSLSLGLFNLIPFPALDGSRVAFALYELLRGKPIPPQREGMIHAIGFLLLIALMLLITYQDILRLFR